MSSNDFQEKVLERLKGIECDIAYVKGVIEGREQGRSVFKDNMTISISCLSLLISTILVITRFL